MQQTVISVAEHTFLSMDTNCLDLLLIFVDITKINIPSLADVPSARDRLSDILLMSFSEDIMLLDSTDNNRGPALLPLSTDHDGIEPSSTATEPRQTYNYLICCVGNHTAVLFVGVFLGLITIFPNLMMSDSGSSLTVVISSIGLFAPACMIIGGIVGAWRGAPWAGWYWLLPGVGLEVLLLATLVILGTTVYRTCLDSDKQVIPC